MRTDAQTTEQNGIKCLIKPKKDYEFYSGAQEICKINERIWSFFILSIFIEISKAISKINFMFCAYSVTVYFLNNFFFDLCFLFLEDTAQLILLIEVLGARGYLTGYEQASLAVSIFAIVSTILHQLMVTCKFYSNSESLEKELQDIHFKTDRKTGNSGITDPLLFWYRFKLEARNHWRFVDDTGLHDKIDYDQEYPKEQDVRSRFKDPRNFRIKKIKWH